VIYCAGNYSLLSPRIQRRINLEIEQKYRGQKISKVYEQEKYIPPCYWCINALSDEDYPIEHIHPWEDVGSFQDRFRNEVPHLKDVLKKFSIFTWCFKLSFQWESPVDRFPPRDVLERRLEKYIGELVPNKSIAFFYVNYDNPLSELVPGDKWRYILLGAGLIKKVHPPRDYQIPSELLEDIRRVRKLRNFSELAWHFCIELHPDATFILPYHEYLDWKETGSEKPEERWRKLKEIVITIDEPTIVPHFKYVSMHLPHDKAIYLLYMIKKVVELMQKHGIVSWEKLKQIEAVVNRLLKIAWEIRGKYPGFNNVIHHFFSKVYGIFDSESLEREIIPRLIEYIHEKYGDVESFMNALDMGDIILSQDQDINRIVRILSYPQNRLLREHIRFLSIFDLSRKQIDRILNGEEGRKIEFAHLKINPYILLEEYNYERVDDWDIDKADWGIGLYQIDIALMPDRRYAQHAPPYPEISYACSPHRLRALIADILLKAALNEGNSCLPREEIIKRIKNYPLYYINEELAVNESLLDSYEEEEPLFRDKFDIYRRGNEKVYRLMTFKEIEQLIESFLKKMLQKRYTLSKSDDQYIHELIEEIKKKEFVKKLNEEERALFLTQREDLYRNALSHGLFVISGRAGTGKTWAIVELIRKFVEDGKTPIYVFAPTGRATLVIRSRLKNEGLYCEDKITVSTIHRFLCKIYSMFGAGHLIDGILFQEPKRIDLFKEIKKYSLRSRCKPKVLIIDEASMVDEILLALLFYLIDVDELDHLILVGDVKQLPPIGVGRPFADIIQHLRDRLLDSTNYIYLETNIRFPSKTTLTLFTKMFEDVIPASIERIKDYIQHADDTLDILYFDDCDDLQTIIKQIICRVESGLNDGQDLFNLFKAVYGDSEDRLDESLSRIQILTPRRWGKFGSEFINREVVLNNVIEYKVGTKLICERNIYIKADGGRVLGLANGSIGYIVPPKGNIYFSEMRELEEDYGEKALEELVEKIKRSITGEVQEREINFGYAITIHKSQGSDFDHVLLVIPEYNPFATKELLYTGFTRPRKKLWLLVHNKLKEKLPLIFLKALENSEVNKRHTLLFGYRESMRFLLKLRTGETIALRSREEWMIAKVLDELGIEFEYEPADLKKYRIRPDFKIIIDGKTYYWEHLGMWESKDYKTRWYEKLRVYEKLGLLDMLITTSKAKETTDIESAIKKIIDDIRNNRMKTTPHPSRHHYYI